MSAVYYIRKTDDKTYYRSGIGRNAWKDAPDPHSGYDLESALRARRCLAENIPALTPKDLEIVKFTLEEEGVVYT